MNSLANALAQGGQRWQGVAKSLVHGWTTLLVLTLHQEHLPVAAAPEQLHELQQVDRALNPAAVEHAISWSACMHADSQMNV